VNCGNCRDWYFTGDRETWNWVRNYENWNDADWKRHRNDRIYDHFKRRDGYSCIDDFGAIDDYGDRYNFRVYRAHCFCVDNVRP